MSKTLKSRLGHDLKQLAESGLVKSEQVLLSPQSPRIRLDTGEAINFCANNYLGLADDPRMIEAAAEGLRRYGFGMASVRFICGTLDIHKELEEKLADFFGMQDAILYSSCFDANTGLFEVLLNENDAVISDSLNHASIIDGIRLCKAKRYRYRNNDMADLECKLKEADGAQVKMIATDGVFSMDGIIADLKGICDLAARHDAVVMVDDSHATGVIGANGRGSCEYNEVLGRVDIITTTLGKAVGGASGGVTVSRPDIVKALRQRSRPYLFSNTLAPVIVYASITALDIIAESSQPRERLRENCGWFRKEIERLGFKTAGADHPIIPVMLGDARLSAAMAADMMKEGIYVVSFSYPVVPRGQARIRVQISAAHSREDLEKAVAAFEKAGRRHGLIS